MVRSRLAMICSGLVFLSFTHSAAEERRAAPAEDKTQPSSALPRATRVDVEHGRYIVERVAMCFECHSTRDAQGNIVAGTRLMGGALPVRPPTWLND